MPPTRCAARRATPARRRLHRPPRRGAARVRPVHGLPQQPRHPVRSHRRHLRLLVVHPELAHVEPAEHDRQPARHVAQPRVLATRDGSWRRHRGEPVRRRVDQRQQLRQLRAAQRRLARAHAGRAAFRTWTYQFLVNAPEIDFTNLEHARLFAPGRAFRPRLYGTVLRCCPQSGPPFLLGRPAHAAERHCAPHLVAQRRHGGARHSRLARASFPRRAACISAEYSAG